MIHNSNIENLKMKLTSSISVSMLEEFQKVKSTDHKKLTIF